MVISSALTQALKWGMVPRSVAPLATLPSVELREPTLPSLEQIAALVRLAKENDPVLSAAVMLAALTGCRRGELCGLRWSDIDRERMVLHVRRAAKRADGGENLIGPTKTHATRRSSSPDGPAVQPGQYPQALLTGHGVAVEGGGEHEGCCAPRPARVVPFVNLDRYVTHPVR